MVACIHEFYGNVRANEASATGDKDFVFHKWVV
jgi:hypothetical protein